MVKSTLLNYFSAVFNEEYGRYALFKLPHAKKEKKGNQWFLKYIMSTPQK
ncbi:MAG: hypothetical protein ACJA13_000259 [Paraglaciecola sp.]|jgi:hypothetical protein